MNCCLNSALAHAQFDGKLAVADVAIALGKERLQPIELHPLPAAGGFLLQSSLDAIEHRKRPLPFKELFRRKRIQGLTAVADFTCLDHFVQRNGTNPTPAFLCPFPILMIGQEVFYGPDQK